MVLPVTNGRMPHPVPVPFLAGPSWLKGLPACLNRVRLSQEPLHEVRHEGAVLRYN